MQRRQYGNPLPAFVLNSKTFTAFLCGKGLFCVKGGAKRKKDFTANHFINIFEVNFLWITS